MRWLLVGGSPEFDPEDPFVREFGRIFNKWPERRSREVGPGFSYATAYAEGVSVWLLLLYGYFLWVVFVSETGPLPGSISR